MVRCRVCGGPLRRAGEEWFHDYRDVFYDTVFQNVAEGVYAEKVDHKAAPDPFPKPSLKKSKKRRMGRGRPPNPTFGYRSDYREPTPHELEMVRIIREAPTERLAAVALGMYVDQASLKDPLGKLAKSPLAVSMVVASVAERALRAKEPPKPACLLCDIFGFCETHPRKDGPL